MPIISETYLTSDYIIAPDNHVCEPGVVDGCTRCRSVSSIICCSLCTPEHPLFDLFSPDDVTKPTTTRASKLRKSDTAMTAEDSKFRFALHDYRRNCMEVQHGRPLLDNLGPGLVMDDETLDRITACARARKLDSLDALFRETKWDGTWDMGQDVLNLVNRCAYLL